MDAVELSLRRLDGYTSRLEHFERMVYNIEAFGDRVARLESWEARLVQLETDWATAHRQRLAGLASLESWEARLVQLEGDRSAHPREHLARLESWEVRLVQLEAFGDRLARLESWDARLVQLEMDVGRWTTTPPAGRVDRPMDFHEAINRQWEHDHWGTNRWN
jgi:hypothetical protein